MLALNTDQRVFEQDFQTLHHPSILARIFLLVNHFNTYCQFIIEDVLLPDFDKI